MKVLWAAYYEFKKDIRDIRVLIALIIFPISIILLLGTVFDDKLSEDFKAKVRTGYIILDKEQTGEGVLQLLAAEETKKLIDARSFSDEAAAREAVEEGEIDNYFIIDENTTKRIASGTAASIRLEGQKNIELVQTILNAYIAKSNAISLALSITGNNTVPELRKSPSGYFERITPLNAKLPEAIDYYAVLTLLQLMTMGAILGIFIVGRNQQSNIHIRLYALPVSKWTLIYGKVLGSGMFLFLSCIITVVFTKYIYHANWDGNLILIGLVLIVFSFLCIGMGIMIYSFINNYASALSLSFLFMIIASSAGGSISPITTIQSLNIINPIYYAKVLLFGILYNYPTRLMLRSASGLLAVTAVIYALSYLKLRRVNYDNI